jgi:hypothetical protein
MTPVSKRATVHEKTVIKADLHAKEAKKPRKRAPVKGAKTPVRPKTSEISHTKVDARVWKTALKLAGGHPKRIRIDSPNSVVVLNKAS